MSTTGTRTAEDVVRRYYALVSDLTGAEQDLADLIHPAAVFVEHPNRLIDTGRTGGADGALAGLRAGRALLSAQRFDVLDVVANGNRVAVRATWSGTVAVGRGPFRAGQELFAWIAGWVELADDGRILRHETYDCYRPFETP